MTSARRARWIIVLFTIFLLVCAARLFQVQIIEGPALAAEGQAVRTSESSVAANRGAIEDATGVVLADSVQTYHIAVNQINILSYAHYEDLSQSGNTDTPDLTACASSVDRTKSGETLVGCGPSEAARQLASLLDMDPVVLGGMMVGDQTYVYLKKDVSAETYRAIRALDIYGIEWESSEQRVYPNDSTAATVIGTVDSSGVGSSGLEAAEESLLKGTAGKEAYEIAPNGAIMPGGKQTIEEPQDGATITTSIHADLQYAVQQILDARVEKHDADWGAVVIRSVTTGDVLVMADSGSTSPSGSAPQTARAVQYAFEPGSVGKVVTMAAALENGTITPTSVFSVPYEISFSDSGDTPIHDHESHETEDLTATGILAESSNVGTILIGQKSGQESIYEMQQRLGLGQTTGIELAGESAGMIKSPSELVNRDKYVTMFGQSYLMTALQEATVMSTIGNGGVRIAPRLVTSWTDADGTVHQPEASEPVQAMSSTTAQDLITMMESTVDSTAGTGQAAAVTGYQLAVKTGTADITVDGKDAVVSTVAGVLPADSPQLAISVVLYNPKVGVLSSDSAAPLFSEVATQAVRNLAIPASSGTVDLFPIKPEQ